jgi:histidine triad (HIT) family protein
LQEYLQTKLARGFISLTPIGSGHCLILPKRKVNVFEELTNDELIEIGYIIRRTRLAVEKLLGPCGYILLQKNGSNVGQSVNHLHWHFIANPKSHQSVLRFALNFINPFHLKLSTAKMQDRVSAMKQAIAETNTSKLDTFKSLPQEKISTVESFIQVTKPNFEILKNENKELFEGASTIDPCINDIYKKSSASLVEYKLQVTPAIDMMENQSLELFEEPILIINEGPSAQD